MPETSDAEQEHSTRRTLRGHVDRADWTMGKRGEGQDAGNRLRMKLNLQKSSKRTLAEAEAAVEELIVFSGLDNSTAMHLARLCSDSSAPTSTHAITDTGERTHRRRRQVIVHSCVLGSNTFLIGKMHTKAARARKRNNRRFDTWTAKTFFLIRRTLQLVWIFVLQMQFVYIYLIIFITNLFSVALICNH